MSSEPEELGNLMHLISQTVEHEINTKEWLQEAA